MEQITVTNVAAPTGAGRPWNVELTDGRKVAAFNGEHSLVQPGQSYNANLYSKVNGQYTNWLFSKDHGITPANGGQAPQQVPGAIVPPAVHGTPKADPVPANIWIQGITQQAVANGNHDVAAAYQWAVDNYANFRDRKPVTPFPGQGNQVTAEAPAAPGGELNDSIPF
jgi:hypothetical protein